MAEFTWPQWKVGPLRRMNGTGHGGEREAADALSDEALAARVGATGDAEAFGLLVARYRTRLIALARRMLAAGGADDAEDVAQEAFVAAYDKRRTYRRGEPFRPWIYRIALNRCLDRLRARQRRPQSQGWDDTGAGPEPAAPTPEPLAALLTDEREARLQQAVAALPPPYRAVFLLRHLDDLSYDEIAVAAGLPLGTVKTHLFRARALLRDALKDYWTP